MKKKIIIIAAILVFLGILPLGIKAEEIGKDNVTTVATQEEFLEALEQKKPKIVLSQGILIKGGTESDVFPLNYDVEIDGNNNTLTLQPSGIILGGDVKLKNLNLYLASFIRNAIIVNGYSLELENVTNGSGGVNAQESNIDIFAGTLTGYKNSEKIPATGNNSKILIKGNNDISKIYAGSLSEDGNENSFEKPVTIEIKTDQQNAIEGIFGFGATELRDQGDVNGLTGDSEKYKSNENVKVILDDVASNTVKEIYGKTGQEKNISLEYKGDEYLKYLTLNDIENLIVTSGNLGLTAASNIQDSKIEITIAEDAVLDLSQAQSEINIEKLDSNGSLVLGKNQTLNIQGEVNGNTSIYIDNKNIPGEYDTDNIYINAANGKQDSFTFKSPNSGDSSSLPTYYNGKWSVTEPTEDQENNPIPGEKEEEEKQEPEEKVTEIEIPTSNSSYLYTGYDIIVIPTNKGYIIEGIQGKDSGFYSVTVKLKEGYCWVGGSQEEKIYNWEIKPITVTLKEVAIKDKFYNNNKEAEVSKLILEDQNGNDFSSSKIKVSAEFQDSNIGNNKKVTVKISTEDPNITIVNDTVETTGNILKQETITDSKIRPKGEPTYTEVNGDDKTLADAKLEKGTISVEGKIAWVFPDSTKIEANKEYAWVFTPNDLNKYQIISGRVVLYKKEIKDETTNKPGNGGNTGSGTTNPESGTTDSGTGTNKPESETTKPGTGNNNVSNNTSSGNTTNNNNTNNSVSNNTTENNSNSSVSNNSVSNNSVSDNTTEKKPEDTNTNKKPEVVEDKRTEQEKLIDNVKDKTTASLTTNKTEKKEDIRLEIRGTYPDEKITKEMQEQGILNADIVREKLKNAIRNNKDGFTAENNILYDVSMIHTKDYGSTWKKATKDNFPADGYLKVSLPIPGQLDPAYYDFAVAHMFTSSDYGKIPGEAELPAVVERTDSYGLHYLDFYVTGLSPIMVTWEESQVLQADSLEEEAVENDMEESQWEENTTETEEPEEEISKEAMIKLIIIGIGSLIFLVAVLWIAKKIAWG